MLQVREAASLAQYHQKGLLQINQALANHKPCPFVDDEAMEKKESLWHAEALKTFLKAMERDETPEGQHLSEFLSQVRSHSMPL